jgi:hypothetical protein
VIIGFPLVFDAEFLELCPHRRKPTLEDIDDLAANLGRREGGSVYEPTPTIDFVLGADDHLIGIAIHGDEALGLLDLLHQIRNGHGFSLHWRNTALYTVILNVALVIVLTVGTKRSEATIGPVVRCVRLTGSCANIASIPEPSSFATSVTGKGSPRSARRARLPNTLPRLTEAPTTSHIEGAR